MMAERDKLMLLVLSVMTDGRMGAGEHSSELDAKVSHAYRLADCMMAVRGLERSERA